MKFGIDRLLADPDLQKTLHGSRVALLAHPASLTGNLVHSMDALAGVSGINLVAAFGPQHGLRGDKQDNMVETQDYVDPVHGVPVFSLYGEVRRPTPEMMESFDVLLVDLQDLGCRIYTFITTLRYMLEAAARFNKRVIVLDRPNPAGRPVEGMTLQPGWESFVGAGPMPMRHGLTMAEMGQWFIRTLNLDLEYEVIGMQGWQPHQSPGFGWPLGQRSWINPSPNAPNLWMARNYAGTVMLEGTTLSEGRGTSRPLELFGAPDLDTRQLLKTMENMEPDWMRGCRLRECWFEPTFHKYAGQLCAGIQIHVDDPGYDHQAFKPWRLMALAFKALKTSMPGYELWRDFEYEYEKDRLAIDLINGSERLRAWVDDDNAEAGDLDQLVLADENQWCETVRDDLIYTEQT